MKEILLLIVITGIFFLCFLTLLIFGIIRKKKQTIYLSVFILLLSLCLSGWTVYKFLVKSYDKVSDIIKPRTGIEIYSALFGKPDPNCVKVLNYQDQIIPRMDFAIILQFETCPMEFKRILSRREFRLEKLPTKDSFEDIPLGVRLDWFRPKTLGDTILVFERASEDGRNIQTFWASLDSTTVFCRDIAD
jgi:hypothetical protein